MQIYIYIYIYKTESLHTLKTNKILQLNYISKKILKKNDYKLQNIDHNFYI